MSEFEAVFIGEYGRKTSGSFSTVELAFAHGDRYNVGRPWWVRNIRT